MSAPNRGPNCHFAKVTMPMSTETQKTRGALLALAIVLGGSLLAGGLYFGRPDWRGASTPAPTPLEVKQTLEPGPIDVRPSTPSSERPAEVKLEPVDAGPTEADPLEASSDLPAEPPNQVGPEVAGPGAEFKSAGAPAPGGGNAGTSDTVAAVMEEGPLLDDKGARLPKVRLRPGSLVQVVADNRLFFTVALPDGSTGLAAPWLLSTDRPEIAVARGLLDLERVDATERKALAAQLRAAHPEARLLPLLDGHAVPAVTCSDAPPEVPDQRGPGGGRPEPVPPDGSIALPDQSGAGPRAQPTFDWASIAEQKIPGFRGDGPLPYELRRAAREHFRNEYLVMQGFAREPFRVNFEVPGPTSTGTYHLLRLARFEARSGVRLRGEVTLDVDFHGCEQRARRYGGKVEIGQPDRDECQPMVVWIDGASSWKEQRKLKIGPGGLFVEGNELVVLLPGGRRARGRWDLATPTAARIGRLSPGNRELLLVSSGGNLCDFIWGESLYEVRGERLIELQGHMCAAGE